MEQKDRTEPAPQMRPLVEDQEFEAAFAANFRTIHRFLARRVGSTLADDLTAETFAVALAPDYVPHVTLVHAGRVDPSSAIRAWKSLESRGSLGKCAIGGMSLIQESDDGWDDLASFSFQPDDQN